MHSFLLHALSLATCVSVELRRSGRDNSLHYLEFGPQYLFQLLAVNIKYHTLIAKRGSALTQAVGEIGPL